MRWRDSVQMFKDQRTSVQRSVPGSRESAPLLLEEKGLGDEVVGMEKGPGVRWNAVWV